MAYREMMKFNSSHQFFGHHFRFDFLLCRHANYSIQLQRFRHIPNQFVEERIVGRVDQFPFDNWRFWLFIVLSA